MGCICSKGAAPDDQIHENAKEKEVKDSSVQLVAPTPSKKEEVIYKPGAGGGGGGGGSGSSGGGGGRGGGGAAHNNNATVGLENGGDKNTVIVERPKKSYHQRCATMDIKIGGGGGGGQQQMTRVVSSPRCADDESNDDWPPWLTSVAGDAIKGWVPRRADSFEKIDKIGQGTYSSVYKARDLETGKIVALKKVRFVNMDPESVRFMAREICILRKLDHPNVMKLEGLVTSRMSNSLYLVFEYMEHDLAGLAATPTIKFTEPQIKCYMQQLLWGLEHCHSRGVLHRDIKGSNLLISNDGVLKIADFGLANFFEPDQSQPLTSRVVTLWYRAPELLLGATEYGPAIDLWSSGCILAELLAGKPIMPGRTEVEQMHKIFKLCGSPSEDFWQKKKFPHATSFKPQQPYTRCVTDTFSKFPRTALALIDKLLSIEPDLRGSAASALSSEFFTTEPLPCDPSNFPKYPPSKEMDAKLRDEEARRKKAEAVKGRGPESVRRGSREIKAVPTPEFVAQGQSKNISTSHKYDAQEEGGSGFRIEPPRGNLQNGYSSYTGSMIHPKAAWNNSATSGGNTVESRPHKSHIPQVIVDLNASSHRRDERGHAKDSTTGYMPRKSRIHYSGPLMPPGGNMDDILKEHERQIQHAVRKARLEKSGTRKNSDIYGQQIVHQNHRGKYGR